MKKAIFVILFAATIAIILVGCGNRKEGAFTGTIEDIYQEGDESIRIKVRDLAGPLSGYSTPQFIFYPSSGPYYEYLTVGKKITMLCYFDNNSVLTNSCHIIDIPG